MTKYLVRKKGKINKITIWYQDKCLKLIGIIRKKEEKALLPLLFSEND